MAVVEKLRDDNGRVLKGVSSTEAAAELMTRYPGSAPFGYVLKRVRCQSFLAETRTDGTV